MRRSRPAATDRHERPPKDYLVMTLDFSPAGEIGTGAVAQIACGSYVAPQWHEAAAFRRPADLQVVCQRGIAFLDLPHTVVWFDEAGQHSELLDHDRPVGEQSLLHFHRQVSSLVLKTSSLEDAFQALAIVNKAQESYAAGPSARIWPVDRCSFVAEFDRVNSPAALTRAIWAH